MSLIRNLQLACRALEDFIVQEMALAPFERIGGDELLSRFITRYPHYEPFSHSLALVLSGHPDSFVVGTVRAQSGCDDPIS
jgi:hypothetical protein